MYQENNIRLFIKRGKKIITEYLINEVSELIISEFTQHQIHHRL